MKTVLRYAVLVVVSLLVGLPVGYLWGRRSMGAGPKIMLQMYALGEYETLSSLQYQQASTAQGKHALLDLLDFMHQLESAQGNAIGNSLEIDRAITYARLALLEEREGNNEKSQDYIRQAQASLRKRENRDYSEAHLREIVAKQDSKSHYALPALFNLRQARK